MHHLEIQANLGKNAETYQDKYELGKLKIEFVKLPVEVLGNKVDYGKYMHAENAEEGDKIVKEVQKRWSKENEEHGFLDDMKDLVGIEDK